LDLCDHYIIGNSQEIIKLKSLIRLVAESDAYVFIYGETGVGKNLVAQTLHALSKRKEMPFIELACDSLPLDFLERELFGYQMEAFPNIVNLKKGKLALAEGGTILLREIGYTSLNLQKKLLRVIQERVYTPLGTSEPIEANCRFFASTTQNYQELVDKGTLREDLYFRLNVVAVFIPPLRERKQDLGTLFDFFADEFIEKYGEPSIDNVRQGMPDFFHEYLWPGNVRELKHIVNELMLSSDREAVREELLGKKSPNETPGALLNRSVQISKIWEQLLERTSKQNNEVINNSLAIIKTIIEKGIVASDEKPIKEAVETIKEQNPVILDHVHDVIKSTVSGTMANLLYNWILPIIISLPK
jgi:transcriptional regulator with PAS, ATPase and Fis domain